MTACFCVGPQNGEPECPCRMRHIRAIELRKAGIELPLYGLGEPYEEPKKPRVRVPCGRRVRP